MKTAANHVSFLIVMLSIKQFGPLAFRKTAYLGWKDGLVAGGTLGSKNPVMEETTKITYWRISPNVFEV